MKLSGNLLINRLLRADIRLVSPSTYARVGSVALTEQLAEQLRSQGRRPYVIPVGRSNPMGAFGYMESVEEIRQQCIALGREFDHLVFACGYVVS